MYHPSSGNQVHTIYQVSLDFKENSITWGDYQSDMNSADITLAEHVANVEAIKAAAVDIAKTLDAKCQQIDLQTDIVDSCLILSTKDKKKLLHVLQKHKELFDGTLGMWKDFQYVIELQDNAKPHHNRPYTVPKAHEENICTEVECLCQIGVLCKVIRSKWGASTFAIPKKDTAV
eukprot:1851367-Ditylum_brightwellii.AAC.1